MANLESSPALVYSVSVEGVSGYIPPLTNVSPSGPIDKAPIGHVVNPQDKEGADNEETLFSSSAAVILHFLN